MHLKNFSLITRDGKVELTPAYDFLNTTVAYLDIGKKTDEIEEVSLPLNGRKKKLSKSIWFNYYAKERLNLKDETISEIKDKFIKNLDKDVGEFIRDGLLLMDFVDKGVLGGGKYE